MKRILPALLSLALLPLLLLFPASSGAQTKIGAIPETPTISATDRFLTVPVGADSSSRLLRWDTLYQSLAAISNNYNGTFTGNGSGLTNLQRGGFSDNVRAWGAVGDGIADDSIAVINCISNMSRTGGSVYFPAGSYRITQLLDIPFVDVNHQRPLRLFGDGAAYQYWSLDRQGGTQLQLEYGGTPAKILTRGIGTLEIDHLLLQDKVAGTNDFILTTGTTLRVHDCEFYGLPGTNTPGTGYRPLQDAIVLGGTNEPGLTTNYTAAFQGYGTVIDGNYFTAVRRAVYARTWCNSPFITRNSVMLMCGGNAPFEVLGSVGGTIPLAYGGVFRDNLIEVYWYKYGIILENARQWTLSGNSFWDPSSSNFVAGVYFGTNTSLNCLIAGYDGRESGATNWFVDASASKDNLSLGRTTVVTNLSARFATLGRINLTNNWMFGDTTNPYVRLDNAQGSYLGYAGTSLSVGSASMSVTIGGASRLNMTANITTTSNLQVNVVGIRSNAAPTAALLGANAAGLFYGTNSVALIATDASSNLISAPLTLGGTATASNFVATAGGLTATNGPTTVSNLVLAAPQWIDVPVNYGGVGLATAAPTPVLASASTAVQVLAFDNGDALYGNVQMPHNLATTNAAFPQQYITPHVHFSINGSTPDLTHTNITWQVEWEIADVNGTYTTRGTNSVTTGVAASAGSLNKHYTASFANITNSTPLGISAIWRCRLTRPASAGQDYSNAHDVLLDGFDMHVPVGNVTVLGSRSPTTQ